MSRNYREAAHSTSSIRPSFHDHLENLLIDESKLSPTPKTIIIFDDVITTGAQYSAAKKLLGTLFPQAQIAGIFIARTKKAN